VKAPIAATLALQKQQQTNLVLANVFVQVLVFHLGGSTLDLSIVENHRFLNVVANKHVAGLGGQKIDNILRDKFYDLMRV